MLSNCSQAHHRYVCTYESLSSIINRTYYCLYTYVCSSVWVAQSSWQEDLLLFTSNTYLTRYIRISMVTCYVIFLCFWIISCFSKTSQKFKNYFLFLKNFTLTSWNLMISHNFLNFATIIYCAYAIINC